jgi:hypothetical protein
MIQEKNHLIQRNISQITSMKILSSVVVATTHSRPLCDYYDCVIIDCVQVKCGDRVLIHKQKNPTENGIYIIMDIGHYPIRADDFLQGTKPGKVFIPIDHGKYFCGVVMAHTSSSINTQVGQDPLEFSVYYQPSPASEFLTSYINMSRKNMDNPRGLLSNHQITTIIVDIQRLKEEQVQNPTGPQLSLTQRIFRCNIHAGTLAHHYPTLWQKIINPNATEKDFVDVLELLNIKSRGLTIDGKIAHMQRELKEQYQQMTSTDRLPQSIMGLEHE